MDKIKQTLIQSLEDNLSHKGMSIELSTNITESESPDYFNVYDELKKENLNIYNDGKSYDELTFLETVLDMLKKGEIDLVINETATEKHINYLKILGDAIQK